jgi:transposase-like protein
MAQRTIARERRSRGSTVLTAEDAAAGRVVDLVFPDRVLRQAHRVSASGPRRRRPIPLPAESEDRCRALLERLRWPDGVWCLRCATGRGIAPIDSRGQFECTACGYQFSVRVGTAFHGSHLPLSKWLLAVYLMARDGKRITTNALQEALGVSYKTAWHLRRRIRAVMEDAAAPDDGGAERGDVLELLSRLLEVEPLPTTPLVRSA